MLSGPPDDRESGGLVHPLWVAVALAIIAAVTLLPTGDEGAHGFSLCVLCGEQGVAEGLLNAALFVPLGLTLAGRLTLLRCLVLGAAVSLGIEVAQLYIPGRFSALGDILFNVGGAGLGWLVARTGHRWLRPAPGPSANLSLGAGALVALACVATGVLVAPSLPSSDYSVQWTPDVEDLLRYGGRLERVQLGGRPLRPGRYRGTDEMRADLEAGVPLRVEGQAGAPPSELAALVAIFDRSDRSVLLLGARREDLLMEIRSVADALELFRPSRLVRGALKPVSPGDRFELQLHGYDGEACLSVAGRETCGLGFTPASGWELFLPSRSLPAAVRRALGPLWLFFLLAPAGYWFVGDAVRSWAGAALATAGLALAPAVTPLVAASAVELVGAASGWTAGRVLSGKIAREDEDDRLGKNH